jgi:hypothetical protein
VGKGGGVSIHKECGAQIRWAHRDDEPGRWLPPLEFAGQAYILTEDENAVLVTTYKMHQCDPDQMEAWAAYKEKLAEIQARNAAEPTGMTNYEIAREQRREETCATDVAEHLKSLGIEVVDYAVAVHENECFEITSFIHVAIDAVQGEAGG